MDTTDKDNRKALVRPTNNESQEQLCIEDMRSARDEILFYKDTPFDELIALFTRKLSVAESNREKNRLIHMIDEVKKIKAIHESIKRDLAMERASKFCMYINILSRYEYKADIYYFEVVQMISSIHF